MSSTDGRHEELVLRFFRERLMPAAMALRGRHARLIPEGPDAATSTYYVVRAPAEEYVFDLSVPLVDVLRAQWKEHLELAELAEEIAELARHLRQKEESGEVSPFIYAMF